MPLFAFLLDACAPSVSHLQPVPRPGGDPVANPEPDQEDTASAPIMDTFTYARPKVDVLFVVDNSSSMNGKNKTFSQAAEAVVTSWLEMGIDFHAGVVDIDANDWLGTLEEYEGARWVDETTPDPIQAITELVEGVPDFSSDETGRRAAMLGLQYTADGQPNAGFLRPDAELDIVLHSDEDDCSEDEPTHDDFVDFLREIRPDRGSVHFHAISYGTDYSSIVDEIGGVKQDVADTPYVPALEAATAMFHRTNVFSLTGRPDLATLEVSVAGVPLDGAASRYVPVMNVVDLDGVPLADGAEVEISYTSNTR